MREQAQQACDARSPTCDWLATLSSLERATVARALARRGLEIEPSPWGRPIGRVHVFNEDVFAERSRLLQFFNHFHYTTREGAIRAELVIGEGERWDQARVDETARRLRDPLWSSVIAVVPVRAAAVPGAAAGDAPVDMLVVTRDIWSLRLNTQYLIQQGKLTNLSLALSENNFLGTRSVLAAAVTMDQGAIAAGPLFIDKNLFGQHIELRARVDAIVNRDDLLKDGAWTREGSQSTISIARSLWSLASEWGAGATFTHRNAIDRQYRGTDLRTVQCPIGAPCTTQLDPATAPADEQLPYLYEMRRWGLSTYAVRQFGRGGWKHQLQLGHALDSQRPRLRDDFPGTVEQRAPFAAAVLPRSELNSVPYLAYSVFTPRYRTLRNIGTYELAEDARLGPDFDINWGVGLEVLGSDRNFQRGSASAGWTVPWGSDGLVRPSVAISTRRQDGAWIDNTSTFGLRVITPTVRLARVVAQVTVSTRWNDDSNRFYTIGSEDGLRGFEINEFVGQRLVRGNLELRSVPRQLWVFRYGGVIFYDVGGADDTFSRLALHHDAGIGFRLLVPQTSRELFRFDLAFPLDDGASDGTRAGTPRLIAGFESAF